MSIGLIKKLAVKQASLAKLIWSYRTNGLYCFNFHRLGDANTTPFDPCVYSCDAQNFQIYLEFFKSNFRIIDLTELYAIISAGQPIKEKLALITFDDGYRDNFDIAYPLLKAKSIPATFFVTTSLIESNKVPWWDEIAWHVKQLPGQELKISIWPNGIAIPEIIDSDVIRKVLSRVKAFPAKINNQLEELRSITKKEIPADLSDNLFMGWEQLQEAEKNGISIGAHSHTHRILSSLPQEELIYELTESKRLLEKYLTNPIESISYPVGGASTYHNSMFKLLNELGYLVGFTFCNMVHRDITNKNYELGRLSIDRPFNELFLKQMILSSPKR